MRRKAKGTHPTTAHLSSRISTARTRSKESQTARGASAAPQVTPKKALAEALRFLGPDATNADLMQFAKERFGLALHFVIVIPRNAVEIASQGKRASYKQGRRKAC
jgi:hypothetical protein